MLNTEDICKKLWSLEEEYGLLDRELSGIKVWQLLRMTVYYQITQATGVLAAPSTEKMSLRDIIRSAGYLINAFTRNPLSGGHQRDILVFDHPRKVLTGDQYVDIYTQILLDALNSEDYEVYESRYMGKHLTAKSSQRRYLDVIGVGSVLRTVGTRAGFNKEDLEYIRTVENALNSAFGIRLKLRPLFAREVKHFRFSKRYYRKLIEKRRPKRIYLVVSYSLYKRPLIAAAKELGVETVEIQHGTLSPFHLGYSFPGRSRELDYFPSTFFTFGDYWKTAAAFPLEPDKIQSYGFPYFTRQKKQYDTHRRRTGQILYISQGVIGKKLSRLALECARLLPNNLIVYKLHPGEFSRWRGEYSDLVEASRLPNVEILDHNRKSLYAYMAESEYQVGVFSTAIYEGLAFGLKTFLADLPGIEYMRDLLTNNFAVKISDAANLKEVMENASFRPFPSGHFFKEDT